MAWTLEQQHAIYDRGTNIIVSAGAGSGKTAVLSERVLEYAKNGGDIKKILVLTFTNAAAGEMKERIRKKLKDAYSKEQNQDKKTILNNAINDIDLAYITTFDAYSLALCKKYYYKLNISSNISNLSAVIEGIKKDEIIEDIFKELYDKDDPIFFKILKEHTEKDDKPIKKYILNIYKGLELCIDIDEFINSYEMKFCSEDNVNLIINNFLNCLNKDISKLKDTLEGLITLLSYDRNSFKKIDILENQWSAFLDDINNTKDDDFDTLKDIFTKFSVDNKKGSEDTKKEHDKAKELIKNIKDNYFIYESIDDIKNNIIENKDYILFLLNISKEVYDRLYKFKLSNMSFSFSDIARMAVKLLKNNEDIKNDIKNNLNEILVDEYQDTSDIQESFLQMISNNNLYMVGDIKQSIYRFRNANPYIFKNKYDAYSKNDGGVKIDLTKNFRSRSEVIDDINLVFSTLMTNDCGDANYKEEHLMQFGQQDYNKESQPYDFHTDILKYENTDDYNKFSQEEIEAFIVGKKIKEIIESKVRVLKNGDYQGVTYGDFAILIDKTKSFVTFKKIFDYLKIPISVNADLNLKDSYLTNIFCNILCLIYKTKTCLFDVSYKHALASVGRSFVYSLSDEDIYKMIVLNDKYEIHEDILYLANLKDISYTDLFYEICDRLKIYEKLSLIGEVDNNLIVLNSISNLFKSFNDLSFDLEEVYNYFSKAIDGKFEIKYSIEEEASNAVKIMTIHKSKGLEYPYVFLPLLQSAFREDYDKSGLSKKYGIFIPNISNRVEKPCAVKKLGMLEEKNENVSERLRLLYVAFTRAREKLILIIDEKEKEKDNENNFNSFKDMIKYLELDDFVKNINLDDFGITNEYKFINTIDFNVGKNIINYETLDDLETEEKTHASKTMHTLPSKESLENLKLGTQFHEALEALDLKNPDIDNLPTTSFIKTRITNLINNPIFKDIKEGNDYHEYEFYKEIDGQMVHGIIDLFIVYKDRVDIIDYKLSSTDSIEYVRQLNLYKKYLSDIYKREINIYLLSILKNEIKKLD